MAKSFRLLKSPFQLQKTASVRELPLQATWALLLWPTWLTAAVRELTLLFVTENIQLRLSLKLSFAKRPSTVLS